MHPKFQIPWLDNIHPSLKPSEKPMPLSNHWVTCHLTSAHPAVEIIIPCARDGHVLRPHSVPTVTDTHPQWV